MTVPAITVENLSKKYRVGHRTHHDSPWGYIQIREILGRRFRAAARKAFDVARGHQIVQGDEVEEFWALKDVSFEVNEGEVIGIIGRNGAGKSTLLKVLSRITEPTAGRVTIRGRVASLLEVGTGFHPELSGRENIYLNGAILGMSRAEIRRKFDEIVAFAEIEKFLETPVKRYSSGMYVRLAFAVAAHLEPEILIIDEVLAVGDAEFQKKCLGKMDEVSRREGRTVLFVSHNMAAVERLCSRALLLVDGSVRAHGDTDTVVDAYLTSATQPVSGWETVEWLPRKHSGTGAAVISKLRLRSARTVPHGGALAFDVMANIVEPIDEIRVSFTIFDLSGYPIGTGFSNVVCATREPSVFLTTTIDRIALAPGQYYMAVAIGRGNFLSNRIEYDIVSDCLHFGVSAPLARDGTLPTWYRGWGSLIFDDVTLDVMSETHAA